MNLDAGGLIGFHGRVGTAEKLPSRPVIPSDKTIIRVVRASLDGPCGARQPYYSGLHDAD